MNVDAFLALMRGVVHGEASFRELAGSLVHQKLANMVVRSGTKARQGIDIIVRYSHECAPGAGLRTVA